MEFISSQLQPSPMTLAIVVSTVSTLWWIDQGAVLRGFVADPSVQSLGCPQAQNQAGLSLEACLELARMSHCVARFHFCVRQ